MFFKIHLKDPFIKIILKTDLVIVNEVTNENAEINVFYTFSTEQGTGLYINNGEIT